MASPAPTQPSEAPQANEPTPRLAQKRRLWPSLRLIGRFTTWLMIAFTLLILLHYFEIARIPFPPFTTHGSIYVDSPEVYTRERLVNDRYDQDYWLRRQLEFLDDAEKRNLISLEISTILQGSLGETGDQAEQSSESRSDPNTDRAGRNLTFEQRFRVVSGVRDMIRQLILENMLDDRHDLTGNSVYGLKFDTTIIPGSNTRQRAFVRVTLEPDSLFSSSLAEPGYRKTGSAAGLIPEQLRVSDNKGVLLWEGYRERDTDPTLRIDGAAEDSTPSNYVEQRYYYESWLDDIAKRLNRMEDSLFESMDGCPTGEERPRSSWPEGMAFYDKLTQRTLAVVLGIPEERFTLHNPRNGRRSKTTSSAYEAKVGSTDIRLPDPWAEYIRIRRQLLSLPGENPCAYRVWFKVLPLDEIFVARNQSTEDVASKNTVREHCPVLENKKIDCNSPKLNNIFPGNGNWDLLVPCWIYCDREKRFVNQNLKYLPKPAVLDAIAKRTPQQQSRTGALTYATIGALEPGDLVVSVESGLLNFIESMSKLDAYTYAIFPKNDVVGVLTDSATRLSGGAAQGGFLDLARRLVASKTMSVLVGYGDGGRSRENDRSVRFGWIISARGEMEPSLKTQLALVSVPAWTAELKLNVTTGWVDSEGRQVATGWVDGEGRQFGPGQPKTMIVNVPPDFAAFDSIFRDDAWVTRGPRIQDDAMDKEIYVIAGEKTQILIPGTRLWRSASVTLGAQTADRIRVLPNMEGIIAEFKIVDLPYANYNPASDKGRPRSRRAVEPNLDCPRKAPELKGMRARPVRLRVWTSEGVTAALAPVCVIYDATTIIKRPPSD